MRSPTTSVSRRGGLAKMARVRPVRRGSCPSGEYGWARLPADRFAPAAQKTPHFAGKTTCVLVGPIGQPPQAKGEEQVRPHPSEGRVRGQQALRFGAAVAISRFRELLQHFKRSVDEAVGQGEPVGSAI